MSYPMSVTTSRSSPDCWQTTCPSTPLRSSCDIFPKKSQNTLTRKRSKIYCISVVFSHAWIKFLSISSTAVLYLSFKNYLTSFFLFQVQKYLGHYCWINIPFFVALSRIQGMQYGVSTHQINMDDKYGDKYGQLCEQMLWSPQEMGNSFCNFCAMRSYLKSLIKDNKQNIKSYFQFVLDSDQV